MVTRWTWADIIRSNHHLDKCLYLKTYLLTFPTISPCRSWWTRILTTLPTFRRSALSKLRLVVTSIHNINHFLYSLRLPAFSTLSTFYIYYGSCNRWRWPQGTRWWPRASMTPLREPMSPLEASDLQKKCENSEFLCEEPLCVSHLITFCLFNDAYCLFCRFLSPDAFQGKYLRTRMWPFLWPWPHPRCVNYVHYYPRADLELCKSSVAEKELDSYFQDLRAEEGQELHLEANVSQLYQEVPFIQSSFIVSVLIIYVSSNRCGGLQKEAKSLKSSIFGHRLN